MRINNGIALDIDVILSHNELEDQLSDGNTHQAVFMQAIFLDGKGLDGACRPIIMGKDVSSIGQFDDWLAFVNNAMSEAHIAAVRAEMVAVRASGVAAMVMLNAIVNQDIKSEVAEKAYIMLFHAQRAHQEGLYENALCLPDALQAIFTKYIKDTPIPTIPLDTKEWTKPEAKS